MATVLPTTATMADHLTLQCTVLAMSRQLRLGMILGIYPCNARGWSSLGGGGTTMSHDFRYTTVHTFVHTLVGGGGWY